MNMEVERTSFVLKHTVLYGEGIQHLPCDCTCRPSLQDDGKGGKDAHDGDDAASFWAALRFPARAIVRDVSTYNNDS